MRRTDAGGLIAHLARLVEAADDPAAFCHGLLAMVMSRTGARSAAVFTIERGEPRLFSSRGLDQEALETVVLAWRLGRSVLERGHTFHVADRRHDLQVPLDSAGDGTPSFALFPVSSAGVLRGFLSVDSPHAYFLRAERLEEIRALAYVVAGLLGVPPDPFVAADTPSVEEERSELLALLEANQWNIQAVSRLSHVTRVTIYRRMQRLGIDRKKPKRTIERPPRSR